MGGSEKQISPLRFAPVAMTGLWFGNEQQIPAGMTTRKTKATPRTKTLVRAPGLVARIAKVLQ